MLRNDDLFEEVVFWDEEAQYGVNYDRGWIGFNYAYSWMSEVIGVVTRHRRRIGIPISHAFIVTGEDDAVEAAFRKGVVRSKISEVYWEKEDRYVVFRKPKGLTPEVADRICATAEEQVGKGFDNQILANSLLQNAILKYTVDQIPGLSMEDYLATIADDPDKYLCSELVAYVLNQQPEYYCKGVLCHPAGAIDPQRLFEDEVLFEPIRTTVGDDRPAMAEEDLQRIRRRLGVPHREIHLGSQGDERERSAT